MAMHVQTEGDKLVFSYISLRQNLRLLLTLFESKPHIIIIYTSRIMRETLENKPLIFFNIMQVLPTLEFKMLASEVTISLKKITFITFPFQCLKLRSHRANGQETDKKSFHPFVSGHIRFMSVSNPVNPFLVR